MYRPSPASPPCCPGPPSAATPSSSPPIEASALHLRYGVSLIGLPIGTASVDGTIGATGYRLEGAGKLTGLAGIIVDTKGAVTAAGTFTGGRVNPASFAASAGTPNYLLTIRMAMEHGTATGVEITPMYQQTPDRIPLTPADRRNIIDPMSSLIMAVPGTGEVIGPQSCNRTIPIFDGGVRFNVLLAYTGTREVTVARLYGSGRGLRGALPADLRLSAQSPGQQVHEPTTSRWKRGWRQSARVASSCPIASRS